MKKVVLIIIVIVVLILLYRAWTKDTIDVDVPPPTGKKYRRNKLLNQFRQRRGYPKPSKKTRSSRENKCRDIFEYLFQEPFPTKRPSFLKNPETGRNLELDGYNSSLQVAFEYNGRQHYDYPNTFHKSEEEFIKQVARDRYKEQRCRENGICLVSIPYTVTDEELESFIRTELEKEGFSYY